MSELIQMERKSWKEEFIRQIFLPVHADTILGIPLSIRLPGDRIIWAETNNSCFTVCSSYKVAMNLHRIAQNASASSDSSHRSFWRKLRQLPIPHKVRHFAWRACRNILPTKDNLFHRKVLTENLCDECGEATESTGHQIWSCPRAQLVWNCSKLPSSLRSGRFHSFFDLLWFLLMIESFDEENVALVVTIAWSLWSNRNLVRHGGSKKTPKALVQWASHYLIDYVASTVSNAVRPEIV